MITKPHISSYLVFAQGVIVERTRDVHQCLGLRSEGLHDFWMAVPLVDTFIERLSVSVTHLIIQKVIESVDLCITLTGISAEEVVVPLALDVPHVNTLAATQYNRNL